MIYHPFQQIVFSKHAHCQSLCHKFTIYWYYLKHEVESCSKQDANVIVSIYEVNTIIINWILFTTICIYMNGKTKTIKQLERQAIWFSKLKILYVRRHASMSENKQTHRLPLVHGNEHGRTRTNSNTFHILSSSQPIIFECLKLVILPFCFMRMAILILWPQIDTYDM